jgi:polysaccharide export outer membrane protein
MHGVYPRFMGKLLALLALMLAVLMLAGCASGPKSNVPYEPAGFGTPDVEAAVAPTEGLQRISPLDKINITVFQVESLSGEFQVDSAGVISFPLIGTVEAQGKTAPELSKVIAQRLGQKYLQNPNVQVSIKESTAQTVTVDGSVRQPGVYPVKGSLTLMRAVALARGATEDANTNRVIVFRTIKGQRMAAAFDLAAIRRATADDPVIYGNDIVVVDGNRARSIFGYVLASIPLLSIFRPF